MTKPLKVFYRLHMWTWMCRRCWEHGMATSPGLAGDTARIHSLMCKAGGW